MAAKTGGTGGQMQTIDLTKLNLMQLTQFKNQMDQDLQFYQESLQNLKHAQSRYVYEIYRANESTPILYSFTPYRRICQTVLLLIISPIIS